MDGKKKKDALTELVDVADSQPSDQQPNNGTVSTPSGEKVELDFDNSIKKIARKITETLNLRRLHRKQDEEVLEQIIKEDYERKKTK